MFLNNKPSLHLKIKTDKNKYIYISLSIENEIKLLLGLVKCFELLALQSSGFPPPQIKALIDWRFDPSTVFL